MPNPPPYRPRLARLSLAAALALAAPLTAAANTSTLEQADPREKLEMLQRKLAADRELQQKLDAESKRLSEESAKLQHALVAAAAAARAREDEQARTESELAALEAKESVAAKEFYVQREQLAGLLAVLQRLGREPPPALLVQPQDAASAARSAMVLTAVLPGVRQEAQRLSANLNALRALRLAAANTRISLTKATEALAAEQANITQLLAAKQTLSARMARDLAATTERVQVASRDARTLTQLIERVDGGVKTLAEAGFAATGFTTKRGKLPWPATGEVVAQFGEVSEDGGKRTTLTLKTRPNAQVVSPVDGKIAFAGPFEGYGQLLIIVAGDDYHIVLSGMASIQGGPGQVLLAGEPVGRMGEGSQQVSDHERPTGGRRLNIEFRQGGTPVDPGPWFEGYDIKSRDKGHG